MFLPVLAHLMYIHMHVHIYIYIYVSRNAQSCLIYKYVLISEWNIWRINSLQFFAYALVTHFTISKNLFAS